MCFFPFLRKKKKKNGESYVGFSFFNNWHHFHLIFKNLNVFFYFKFTDGGGESQ